MNQTKIRRLARTIPFASLALVGVSCIAEVDGDVTQKQQAMFTVEDDFQVFETGMAVGEWFRLPISGSWDKPRYILGGLRLLGTRVPATTRVKRRMFSEFDVSVRSWKYIDLTGETASVPMLVAQSGTHRIHNFDTDTPGDFAIHVGRVKGMTHEKKRVDFGSSFNPSKTPIVFATQVTHNGADPTVVRVTDVDKDGFSVYLDEEGGDTHSSEEDVDWVAFEKGHGIFSKRVDVDGMRKCIHVKTGRFVTDEHSFGIKASTDTSVPNFYGLQTDNGKDAASAQFEIGAQCDECGPSEELHWVRVAEEGSDGENEHVDETIGFALMSYGACPAVVE